MINEELQKINNGLAAIVGNKETRNYQDARRDGKLTNINERLAVIERLVRENECLNPEEEAKRYFGLEPLPEMGIIK